MWITLFDGTVIYAILTTKSLNKPIENHMNKLQFVEQLAVELGITSSEAQRFVNGLTKLIYNNLAADNSAKITISGFGQFSVSHRASRLGVNPRNPSQKITIPELNTPKFRAGEAFKAAVALKN